MSETKQGGTLFGTAEIEAMLPHRYPMLLVDRIIEMDPGKRIVGLKNVTMNEWFFQGHFPGHPIMPGVLIVEAMAQCGGVLVLKMLKEPESKLFYFMSIDECKFRRPVTPGDTLKFVLVVEKIKGNICRMRGEAFVDGELACEAVLLSMLLDRQGA